MQNIEVELRSFISKEKYENLIKFFQDKAKFLKEDYQETYYFDAPVDLRIQKNNFFSKIWMKKGKIHDDAREEIEVKFAKEDFEKLERLFLAVGLNVQIKWFRNRHEFEWNDFSICVDYTKGYGYILEIEKLCSEDKKEETIELVNNKFKELNIPLTPKEEFDNKYIYYKENWKSLINN